MTADDRYDVSGLPDAQFEPGSNDQVLKNLLGIISRPERKEKCTGSLLLRALSRLKVEIEVKAERTPDPPCCRPQPQPCLKRAALREPYS